MTNKRVRTPKPGVVKSLELIGSGPVGLVHTRKAGIKYKKPTSPNTWYPRDIG